MTATVRAAVFGAFVSFVGAAAAAGEASVPEVTVTAPRPPTAQELAGDAVPKFVKSHSTLSRVIGQMPRWTEPLCPRVKGLNDAMDNFVTARIRAVAAAVGAPHDESPDCKANVVIFFTFVPQKLVYDVLRIDSSLLGFHYPSETKKYTVFNHAIQGWYVTATRNSNGLEVIDDPQGFGTYAEVDLGGGSLGSRLRTRISALIIYATIIADIDKLKGMTIGSISDYLAVLTLTGARLSDDCSQLPSIMDLMASGCADDKRPNQITAGDLAYMRALYSVLPDTPVALERSSIEDQMFRAFKRGR